MADNNKCGYEICSCAAADGEEYCCQQCELDTEEDITAIKCDCAHPGCAGEV